MTMTTCNYLIEIDDSITTKIKINEIIEDNDFINEQISIYDLDNDIDFGNILEDLNTYSLLSEKKVIIIKTIEKIKDDDKDRLYKYLDNPKDDVLLIIQTNKLDHKLKIYKELKNRVTIINEELNPITYIKNDNI